MTEVQKQELINKLEGSLGLGRKQKKILQRELRQKYSDKDIRVSKSYLRKLITGEEKVRVNNNVTPFTSAERRALWKDKKLINEIIKIIRKYLPKLLPMFSQLSDNRNPSYVTFEMKTLMVTRLLALICGITSMHGINREMNTDECISNISKICEQELKEIPDWQTIQDVLEEIPNKEMEEIIKYIAVSIIRSKMFKRFVENNRIQLLVDATGITSLDYNLNENCLWRTKGDNTKFYKYVLEAKIVFGHIVISIDTEWIENNEINNENDKQDCEVNAFTRMAPRIKKKFPRMKFLVTGDALYATNTMMNICKGCKWDYIFNLKKKRLKNLYEEFMDNVNYENETTKENYYLSTGIKYKDHIVSAFKYIEIKDNEAKEFNYVSNLKVTNDNIVEMVEAGRRRWRIENEGFNMQKNGTFCISHLCSRQEIAMKNHYYFVQIAHTIRQLLEFGSLMVKELRLQKKEVSSFLKSNLTKDLFEIDPYNLQLNFQLRFDDMSLS